MIKDELGYAKRTDEEILVDVRQRCTIVALRRCIIHSMPRCILMRKTVEKYILGIQLRNKSFADSDVEMHFTWF